MNAWECVYNFKREKHNKKLFARMWKVDNDRVKKVWNEFFPTDVLENTTQIFFNHLRHLQKYLYRCDWLNY